MNTVTLPATRLVVPESEYNLSGLKTLTGRETREFEVKIRRGKTVVAHAHNDGNGGQTFIQFINRDEDAAFTAWVEGWTSKIESSYIEGSYDYEDHYAVDSLVEEAILLKELKRRAKKQFLYVNGDENPAEGFRILTNMTFEDPRLKEVLKDYTPDASLYWNGEGWVAP